MNNNKKDKDGFDEFIKGVFLVVLFLIVIYLTLMIRLIIGWF